MLADWTAVLLLFSACALMVARLDRLASRQVEGTAAIVDGDTLRLAGARIRLRGIDAFERGQTCRHAGADGYDCGAEAAAALARLVGGRAVACEGRGRDRYGRLLAVCTAGGRDLNAAMVSAGWAVAYGAYDLEERRARAAGAGAWAGTFERPADWRGTHGGRVESPHDILRRLAALATSLLWAQDEGGKTE